MPNLRVELLRRAVMVQLHCPNMLRHALQKVMEAFVSRLGIAVATSVEGAARFPPPVDDCQDRLCIRRRAAAGCQAQKDGRAVLCLVRRFAREQVEASDFFAVYASALLKHLFLRVLMSVWQALQERRKRIKPLFGAITYWFIV